MVVCPSATLIKPLRPQVIMPCSIAFSSGLAPRRQQESFAQLIVNFILVEARAALVAALVTRMHLAVVNLGSLGSSGV